MRFTTRIMTVMLLCAGMCSAYASDDYQVNNDIKISILTTAFHLDGDTKPLLSVKDIAHMQQVNRAWRRAASDDRVWKMQAAYIFKFNTLPENFYWNSCSETAKEIYLKHAQKAENLPSVELSQSSESFFSPVISFISTILSYVQKPASDHPQASLILCSIYKEMIMHEITIRKEVTELTKKIFDKDQFGFLNDDLNKRLAVVVELFGDSSIITTSLDLKNQMVIQTLVLGKKDKNRFKDSEMISDQNLQTLENLGSCVAKRKNRQIS